MLPRTAMPLLPQAPSTWSLQQPNPGTVETAGERADATAQQAAAIVNRQVHHAWLATLLMLRDGDLLRVARVQHDRYQSSLPLC